MTMKLKKTSTVKTKSLKKKARKKHPVFDVKLDDEEKELLRSVNAGEWKTVDNLEEELAFAKRAAANFLRKDARITLRVTEGDLYKLQCEAAQKGLPYQTFIASILHQYVTGQFIEKPKTT